MLSNQNPLPLHLPSLLAFYALKRVKLNDYYILLISFLLLIIERWGLLFTYELTAECRFDVVKPKPVAATLAVARGLLYARTSQTLMTTMD